MKRRCLWTRIRGPTYRRRTPVFVCFVACGSVPQIAQAGKMVGIPCCHKLLSLAVVRLVERCHLDVVLNDTVYRYHYPSDFSCGVRVAHRTPHSRDGEVREVGPLCLSGEGFAIILYSEGGQPDLASPPPDQKTVTALLGAWRRAARRLKHILRSVTVS